MTTAHLAVQFGRGVLIGDLAFGTWCPEAIRFQIGAKLFAHPLHVGPDLGELAAARSFANLPNLFAHPANGIDRRSDFLQ